MNQSIPTPTSSSSAALAWRRYLESGEVNSSLIRQPIAESWQRSQIARVDPFGGKCQHILESHKLDEAQEKSAELLLTAAPLMESYYQLIEGTDAVFVLIDANGFILKMLGAPSVLADAKKINFMSGANWTEERVGTNAIGTSLVIQKPINVTADEHFCQSHHAWTCSAAPIFDTAGKLLGIIDISGPSSAFNDHTLGIAAAIASSTTMKFMLRKMEQDLRLMGNRFATVFRNTTDGLIEVDVNGVITYANAIANRVIQPSRPDIAGKSLSEVMGHHGSALSTLWQQNDNIRLECCLPVKDGKRKYLVCGEPLIDASGGIAGGLLLLKPLDESPSAVNLANTEPQTKKSYTFGDVIGTHPAIIEAKQLAQLAATNLSWVLLQGECGTGKEIFAQAIHHHSPRGSGPFIAVNCGAIPRDLIGSELFGYEEGAFTGAKRGGKSGKFEQADGGTLFLDEVGDMPTEQQVALLRVLQEQTVTPIGGHREIRVDVRIICASNKNLFQEVSRGRFREDLYYRLNVITIDIPPLRERKEDVLLLFRYFLKKYETLRGREYAFDPEVLVRLQSYHWPGNVRELKNVVERLTSLTADRVIRASCLPPEILSTPDDNASNLSTSGPSGGQLADRQDRQRELAATERREIVLALDRCYGNVSRTALALGMSRNTLYRKMRLYGIQN